MREAHNQLGARGMTSATMKFEPRGEGVLSPCQKMHYSYSSAVWLGASQERDSTALGNVHTEQEV